MGTPSSPVRLTIVPFEFIPGVGPDSNRMMWSSGSVRSSSGGPTWKPMERTPDLWSCARSRSPGCTGGQSVQSSRGLRPSRGFADWDDGASGSQAAGSLGRRRPAPGGRTIARGRSWRIERRPAGARPEWSTRLPSAEWIVAIRARSTTTTMTATAWSSLPGPLVLCCSAYAGTAQPTSRRPSRCFGPSARAVGCFSSPIRALTTM